MAAWGMIEFPYGMDHVDGIGEGRLFVGGGGQGGLKFNKLTNRVKIEETLVVFSISSCT